MSCVYPGCDQPRGRAHGLCNAHYLRRARGYNMDKPVRKHGATDQERFWVKTDKSGECWIWTGARTNGYGVFRINRRNMPAHRVSYIWANGPIPQGLEIDHMCFNRACVNPDHLRALTHAENGQNRPSANRNSRSGIRGVHWDSSRGLWIAAAGSLAIGAFHDIQEANAAVVAWRRQHMPASILDQREAS